MDPHSRAAAVVDQLTLEYQRSVANLRDDL